jgi:ATP-dependent DNA ligase
MSLRYSGLGWSRAFSMDQTTARANAQVDVPARLRSGLEGIVAKRVDSRYKSGRCTSWVKVKNPAYERRVLE